MSKHHGSLLAYFWEHVEKLSSDCERANREKLPNGCWRWILAPDTEGYGRMWKKEVYSEAAHVFSYRTFVGPVPEGMELDHLCRNRWCCNPQHLEAVSHQENIRRGYGCAGINFRKIICERGHVLNSENTHIESSGSRRCRTCRAEAKRRWTSRHVEVIQGRHHRRVLSEYGERAILFALENGDLTQKDLARAWDVSTSTINNLAKGRLLPGNVVNRRNV